MNDYHFTQDWFSSNIKIWHPLLNPWKTQSVQILEIGSYEGRSCVWLCENILLHPDSKIECIDIFNNEEVFNNFKHNVSFFKDKVTYYQSPSSKLLKLKSIMDQRYDLIYVDGDHRACAALEDAVLSFPLLKRGGIMIFDDYQGGDESDPLNRPGPGADAFVSCYLNQIQVLHRDYQMIIKKVV